jgi:Fic family protein
MTDVIEAKTRAELDAAYKPFLPFEAWQAIPVDDERWQLGLAKLQSISEEVGEEDLRAAVDVVKRAAAIETGAIEDLYKVDQGITLTFATENAILATAFSDKQSTVRRLIDAQVNAYDYVLDFVTKKVEVAQAWIRELHQVVCDSQDAYTVHLENGATEQRPLPKGKYKETPNHVQKADGRLHAYAPVVDTPLEMQRLCDEMHGAAFTKAHPFLQAAYVHHAFVVVHPFADGNGRVARALASIFSYRAAKIPLLILAEQKRLYFDALAKADDGDAKDLVTFIGERFTESLQYATDSLLTARSSRPAQMAEAIRRLYISPGGYTHAEIDSAGQALLHTFQEQLDKIRGQSLSGSQLGTQISTAARDLSSMPKSHRRPVADGHNSIIVTVSAPDPAGASVQYPFSYFVPRGGNRSDEVVMAMHSFDDGLAIPLKDLFPKVTTGVSLRCHMYAERVWGIILSDLHRRGLERLRTLGY